MIKRVYEVVLWDAGDKITLGYFRTKKEAIDALATARRRYPLGDEELQRRISDGIAGFMIEDHNIGWEPWVEVIISANQENINEG